MLHPKLRAAMERLGAFVPPDDHEPPNPTPLPVNPGERVAKDSAAVWGEFHARTRRPVSDPAAEFVYVRSLADGLPKGCECRGHWSAYLKAVPPDFDAYEAWGVAAHNAVNKRIGNPPFPPRPKHRFAYFTGSNRPDEGPRIAAMIASARRAGVSEDFHVFGVTDVPDAVNHRIAATRSWKNHMTKIDLLKELATLTGEQYDYFVWLDTDNWFVRDPGDLLDLLRDEPVWVGLETRLADSVHGDWWGMPKAKLVDLMVEAGCPASCVRGCNGGMWIVRREAVAEFHRRTFAAYDFFRRQGYSDMADEPPLAVVGSTMVAEPERNLIERCSHIWACDWMARFRDRLPDGQPFLYTDWPTQKDIGDINPAIVHNMRGKHLMTREVTNSADVVGPLVGVPEPRGFT